MKRIGPHYIGFEDEDYVITIENVYCFPQCFAAVTDRIGNMLGRYVVTDIGSWTKDITCIDERKVQPDKCINCEVDTFGAECIEINRFYGKNNATKYVKAHHYIISFAPEDNITMQEAMDFGKQYVEKFLLGHQAILSVHQDGHNGTRNVHVHIVINSVRKFKEKRTLAG